MARGKSDEEMLALQRAVRMLDELEDPRSRARIGYFLYLRYTAAGEEVIPPEDRVIEIKPRPVAPAPSVPTTAPDPNRPPVAVPTTSEPPVGAPDVTTRPGTTTAPGSGSAPASGWNVSGKGSAHDDTPMAPAGTSEPAGTKKAAATKIEPSKDGKGWDLSEPLSKNIDPNAEVEVKI